LKCAACAISVPTIKIYTQVYDFSSQIKRFLVSLLFGGINLLAFQTAELGNNGEK
jgi:hypothetical protein